MKFNKDTVIGTVLEKHKNAEEILTGFGMHCLYCPCSQAETLEEACAVHGIDVNAVVEKLNENSTTKSSKKVADKTAKSTKATAKTIANATTKNAKTTTKNAKATKTVKATKSANATKTVKPAKSTKKTTK